MNNREMLLMIMGTIVGIVCVEVQHSYPTAGLAITVVGGALLYTFCRLTKRVQ